MKISKTQKEAVISLLREKFAEKQLAANKQFEKDHAAEIAVLSIEYNGHIEAIEDAIAIINDQMTKLSELIKSSDLLYKRQYLPGINYDITEHGRVYKIYNKELLLDYPEIEQLDFTKVSRQLELDSLSKDFDLDAFLKKYLED
jgi:hypothetical protein